MQVINFKVMADYIILEEDAQYFARQAVLLDSHQEYEEAKFYYMVSF